jgi:putative flippase GtrA
MEQNLETKVQVAPQVAVAENKAMVKKDYWLGVLVGLLIGIMSMPVLKMAKPDLYYQLRLALIPFFLIGTPLGLYVCHALSKKIAVMWQFGKFFVTGVMNVLVDFGVLAIITLLFKKFFAISSNDVLFTIGATVTFYSLYKAISFTVSNINSYFWNKHWTFNKSGDKKSEFLQFFMVSVVGFSINVVIASLVFKNVTPLAGMNLDQWGFMGAAAGSIAGLMWNFLGYKFLVFKK